MPASGAGSAAITAEGIDPASSAALSNNVMILLVILLRIV